MEASLNYDTRKQFITVVKPEDPVHPSRRKSTHPQEDATNLVKVEKVFNNIKPVCFLQETPQGQTTPHCVEADDALNEETMSSNDTKSRMSGTQCGNKPSQYSELGSNNTLLNHWAPSFDGNIRETFKNHKLLKNAYQNIMQDDGQKVPHVKFEAKPEMKQRVQSQVPPWSVDRSSHLLKLKMTNEPSGKEHFSDHNILHYQKDCRQGKKNATAASLISETNYEFKIKDALMEIKDNERLRHFESVSSSLSHLEMTSGLKQIAEPRSHQTSFTLPNVGGLESVAQRSLNKTPGHCKREMSKGPKDLYQSYSNMSLNSDCDHRISCASDLERHVKQGHPALKMTPDKKRHCNVSLKQQTENIHQDVKKRYCPHCPYGSRWTSALKRHIEAVHIGLRRYRCPHCPYKSSLNETLKNHIEVIHQDIKKYCCPYCQFKCGKKGNLKQHIEVIHIGIKKYSCPYCQYKCSQARDFQNHIEVIHQGIKKNCCPYCQYRCTRKSGLKQHIDAIHHGIKKHCCPYCQYKCSRKHTLKQHIEKIHQGIKKHCCPYCQYKCGVRNDLKRHIEAVHQDIKKYCCPHCQSKWGRKDQLKQHIETVHQGIKKYCCPQCQYKCSRSGSLKRHMKSIHQSF